MKSYAKVFAILAVAFMLVSAVPVTICDYSVEGSSDASLPSSYDLRDTYKNVTSVKNQGSEGLCWAFATAAALEGEMINLGYDNASTTLSPLYEAVMQYDATTYSGEGDCNVLYVGQLNTRGGYTYQPGFLISDGKGPMYEYIAPYNEFTPNYYIDKTISDSSTVIAKQVDYYDPMKDADEIKSMLMQGHVGVFMYKASSANIVAACAYSTESTSSDHAVALVGWDDNYSKDKFSPETPAGDGAWIIKNSWGETAGENGYVYVSYYNQNEAVAFFSDVVVNDGSNYVYSYDHGYSVQHDLVYRGNATMGNVFTAERDERLTGTSFTIYDKSSLNQDYSVSVYKLSSNYKYASNGQLVASVKDAGTVDHNGTYHVEFDNPISLKEGEIYSICVEFSGDTVTIPVDTTEDFYMVYTSYTVASAGQSYVCYDGKWTDISSDGKSNVRIKAYTSTDIKYEASVNGRIYEKLSDAIADAKSGDSVKLLGDTTVDQMVIGKDLNLILCGYTLTVNIIDYSKPAISAKDCVLGISYGEIRCAAGSISTNGGKLNINRVTFDNGGSYLAVDSVGTDVTINGLTYRGMNGLRFSGGNASVSNSYLYCSGCVLESVSCNAKIVSGEFHDSSVDTLKGKVTVIGGKFYTFNPSSFVDSGSYVTDVKQKSVLVYYNVEINEVSSDSGKIMFSEAFEEGGNMKMLRDVNIKDELLMPGDNDITVDLNGYNLSTTQTAEMIMASGCNITFINTSSTVSTISCTYLYSTTKGTEKLTIGDNVNVTFQKDLFLTKTPSLEISSKSLVQNVGGNLNNSEIIRYTTEAGQVSKTFNLSVFDDYRVLINSYTGDYSSTGSGMTKTGYTVTNGKAFDPAGNQIGTWERSYSTNTLIGSASEITTDTVTYPDGTRSVSITKSTTKGGTVLINTVLKAKEGGEANICTALFGASYTEVVNPELLQKAKADLDDVLSKVTFSYKDVNKKIIIVCQHSDNKILEKDVINPYLSGGYDIAVEFTWCQYTLESGTGLLTGDTVIEVTVAGKSSFNDAQDKAITTGIGYNIAAYVNDDTVPMPCDCTIILSNTAYVDAEFYSVDDNGVLTQLNSEYDKSTRSYTVYLGNGSSFVMNPVEYDNSAVENTVLTVTVIVGVLAVIGACIVLLRRRL